MSKVLASGVSWAFDLGSLLFCGVPQSSVLFYFVEYLEALFWVPFYFVEYLEALP